jgi:pimeloyl-ACP methyl ester carboxylesterase
VQAMSYKNTEVSFEQHGKGMAVVMLHGFLENKAMWKDYVRPISQRNRVITIDLLGHGLTGSLGYVHSMEDQASLVHHILTELKIRKAILIGHSMGGYVALAFAELYPEFMKGLVLLNSTSKADNEDRKTNRDRAINAVKSDYTSFVRLSIANLFSEDNRTRLANEIESVKLEALKTPLQGIVAALEGMKIRKGREVLLQLASFPILLILGKKDGVLNYDESVSQIEDSNVRLVAFPDGHMSHIENKSELLNVLLTFLKNV